MGEFVRLEIDGAVGVIRLDRPPVNAINTVIHRELQAIATQVAQDPAIRAVVLYGGDRAFAAGADIKEMVDLNPGEMACWAGSLNDAVSAIARLPQPVIAAINGYALGGGCELALAADLRIVAENAKLGLPEITLGVIPGAGGTQRLPRLIGASRAKELIFSGRTLDRCRGCRHRPGESRGAARAGVRRGAADGPDVGCRPDRGDGGGEAGHRRGYGFDSGGRVGNRGPASSPNCSAREDQKTGMTSFLQRGPGKAAFVGR